MRRLGRSGLEVSALALGAMNFGMPGWGCDEDEAQRILAVYSDAGGNFLDTANIYAGGDSERILGRPVAGRRSEFVIASKVGLTLPGQSSGLAPDAIRAALLATLGRLGTDYLDLLQIHASTRALPNANSPLLERV